MKLLKTVLLSTTLMMSTAFGSELLVIDEVSYSANRSDAQVFADTLAEIRAENTQYLNMIKTLVSKVHVGDVASTDSGEFVDYIKALAKGLNATLRGKTQLESDLKTATGQLITATAANEELTAAKTEVEAHLSEATEKLDAVTKEKDSVDEKLAAAITKVAELSESLAITERTAEETGGKADEKITGLTAELKEARAEVNTLTAQVNDLNAANSQLQVNINEAKAATHRIADELAAAAKTRRLAAAAVNLNE